MKTAQPTSEVQHRTWNSVGAKLETEPWSNDVLTNRCSPIRSAKARRLTLTLLALSLVCSPLRPCASASPEAHPQVQRLAESRISPGARPRATHRLPSEQKIPALSSLAAGWAQLARTTHFVNTTNHGVAARVAIHEVGTGPRVMVCIHGMLSESANWRYVASALAVDYELWLIDLPGCGQSDAPAPKKVGPGGYGPAALADRVLQVLDARLAARPEVRHFLLAGHSLGGTVVLRMFADDTLRQRYGGVLNVVDGLALFAPCDVVVTQFTPTQHAMLGLNGCKVILGSLTGVLPKAVERSIVADFTDRGLASRELKEQGVRLLSRGIQRHVVQAMLRDALPWRVLGKELDWSAIEALERNYRMIPPPCLIVWGACDATLPVAMGYKLKEQLPDARLVVVPRAKHLLQLECPAVCAQLVREFDEQRRTGQLAAARSVRTLWPSQEYHFAELEVEPPSPDSSLGHHPYEADLPRAATATAR
jgi:pimeloyl-ACP methyl ester carboxylesterase